ncbi:hypothetical protein QEV68_02315 [Trueperella pyogenes]|uniref:hypothetical protein n=1 Tax=Trueperella pyogenes TaxID=1661 RepID=UPI003251D527
MMLALAFVAALLVAAWTPWQVRSRGGPTDRLAGVQRGARRNWTRVSKWSSPDGQDGTPAAKFAVDTAVVLDLAAAALGSGISIPSTLKALDVAAGGQARTQTANLLLMGAKWDEAWEGAANERLREALRAAWTDGAAPVPLVERSAQSLRLQRQRKAKEAAARLGAKLVMPLGLCFLPAFILLGIVPVIAGAASALL